MQFFWKHLHNNKGDENVSKLIWIVIAFVIGALLLSTMSVAFRTEGEGSIGGWLNSTIDSWFGEADGRDGSTGGGTGSGGGLGGGGGSGGGAGGSDESIEGESELDGIVLKYDGTSQLTTDATVGGSGGDYTATFSAPRMTLGSTYATSAIVSSDGSTLDGLNFLTNEAVAIDISKIGNSDIEAHFQDGTYVLKATAEGSNETIYIGVDDNGNIVVPLDSDPANGSYVVFDTADTTADLGKIVLTWDATNNRLTSDLGDGNAQDYSDYFANLVEGYKYPVEGLLTTYKNGADASGNSILDEYATAKTGVFPFSTSTLMLTTSNGQSMGVDDSGNILITGISEPTQPYTVYAMNADAGIEDAGAGDNGTGSNTNDNINIAKNIIPDGCTYYVGVTSNQTGNYTGASAIYYAGDAFPSNVKKGDIFVQNMTYGNNPTTTIEYRYGYYYYGTYWIDGSYEGWGVRSVSSDIQHCRDLFGYINDKPVTNMTYAFYECDISEYAISSLKIPNTITDMAYAFFNCTSITSSPETPNSVTRMYQTYYGCTNLKTPPIIPASVSNLGYTFYGCTSLETAPDLSNCLDATYLYSTFENCSALKSMPKLPSTLISLNGTFKGCSSLTGTVDLSRYINLTSLSQAFYSCSSLETVSNIPASVTNMDSAFYGCKSLTGTININASNISSCSLSFSTALPLSIYVPAGSTTYNKLSSAVSSRTNISVIGV